MLSGLVSGWSGFLCTDVTTDNTQHHPVITITITTPGHWSTTQLATA